jgi:hypothetical protein
VDEGSDRQVDIPNKVHVKWPNGSVNIVDTATVIKKETYSDHGKGYDVDTVTYHLEIEVNGIKSFVPLEKVELWAEEKLVLTMKERKDK